MTKRDAPWSEGTPCWVDVMVPDAERAATFYGALLGWEFAESGAFRLAQVDGRSVAGIGELPSGRDVAPAWTVHLAVADADEAGTRVTAAGGQVLLPAGDVGSAGRMAVVADPTGAVFGLWQPRERFGVELAGEPGALARSECLTDDVASARAFYTDVFGYRAGDADDGDLVLGERVVAGIGSAGEGAPRWRVSFAVRDVEAAAVNAIELGGAVLSPPADSPHGRWATVADDQNATCALLELAG